MPLIPAIPGIVKLEPRIRQKQMKARRRLYVTRLRFQWSRGKRQPATETGSGEAMLKNACERSRFHRSDFGRGGEALSHSVGKIARDWTNKARFQIDVIRRYDGQHDLERPRRAIVLRRLKNQALPAIALKQPAGACGPRLPFPHNRAMDIAMPAPPGVEDLAKQPSRRRFAGQRYTVSERSGFLTRQPGEFTQDLHIGGPQIFGWLISVNVIWIVGLWAGAEAASLQQRGRDWADGCTRHAATGSRLDIQHIDQAVLDVGRVIVFALAGGGRLQIFEPAH